MNVKSCDTFVVFQNCAKNLVIFGKNSDRPQNEVQEIIYKETKTYPPGSILKCTYIDIEQANHVNSVILSKPSWMWGAEMGSNEFGVCVGNEAVWTKIDDNPCNKKLLGMDLVRLGLERSKTAAACLDVIVNLLEKYGQGGPCSETDPEFSYHNSFLIIDPTEGWILETAGSFWAAKRITSGHHNISNCLTIESDIDKMSNGLKENCKKLNLWDGNSDFSFKKVFGTSDADCDRLHSGRKLLQDLTAHGKFTLTDMFTVLRDEESGICRSIEDSFPTQASMVSVLSNNSSRPHCHWFTATPDPSKSVFKPFIFTPNANISSYVQSPVANESTKPADRKHALYKSHEKAIKKGGKGLLNTLFELENTCVREMEDYLSNFKNGTSKLDEIRDLFKDCVESELKFYS